MRIYNDIFSFWPNNSYIHTHVHTHILRTCKQTKTKTLVKLEEDERKQQHVKQDKERG